MKNDDLGKPFATNLSNIVPSLYFLQEKYMRICPFREDWISFTTILLYLGTAGIAFNLKQNKCFLFKAK